MRLRISRRWTASIGAALGILGMLLVVTLAMAQGPEAEGGVEPLVDVATKISYQGVLKESGVPVTGDRDMVFALFTTGACAGVPMVAVSKPDVPVSHGVFSVELSLPHGAFNGQALWLGVQVEGTVIDCREILPVPYAMSLKPGAIINIATGSALSVMGNSGNGLYGHTLDSFAVYGHDEGTTDAKGYGGYFVSQNGIALFGQSFADRVTANRHAPGVYGRSTNGVGVYGLGDGSRPGVLGESTNGDGVKGVSEWDYGVHGSSTFDFGGYFYSQNETALHAESDDTVNWAAEIVNNGGNTSPGLYLDGYFSATGSKTGYVVDIAINDGAVPLESGDVVVITGASEPVLGQIPLVEVRKASEAGSTAVSGVVDQPFTVEGEEPPLPEGATALASEGTSIGWGEYLSMVTLGAFKSIKVDASFGAIQPGDLLVSSSNPGHAMKAESPRVGTVIGKALGELESGTGVIPVQVMLQ
jgi:hypothetical protein